MPNNILPIGTLVVLFVLLIVPLSSQAKVAPGYTQSGLASYYHDRFHGRKTASGGIGHLVVALAAHKSLPLGTWVRVTTDSGKSLAVKINDRGPFVKGRIIDLSRRAARELGMINRGLSRVKVEVIRLPVRGA